MATTKPKLTGEELWLERQFGTKVDDYKEYKGEGDKDHKYWIANVKRAHDLFLETQKSFDKAQKIPFPKGDKNDIFKKGELYFQMMGDAMREANNNFRKGRLELGTNGLLTAGDFADSLNEWADQKFAADKLKTVKGH